MGLYSELHTDDLLYRFTNKASVDTCARVDRILLSNSLILIGIPTYWQKVFTGAIIIIGTGVSAYRANAGPRGRSGAKSKTRAIAAGTA